MRLKTIFLILFLFFTALLVSQRARGQSGGFVIEQADAASYINVTGSSSLNALIAQTAPRFVVEYANNMRHYGLTLFPSQLQNLLDGLPRRFIIEYANANRTYTVGYPIEMISDILPPTVSNLSVSGSGTVRWETDEYSVSELRYGTQSGNYPNILQYPAYSKLHLYQLSGLSTRVIYYFKISNTDRSGNTSESAESTFTIQSQLFLPLLIQH